MSRKKASPKPNPTRDAIARMQAEKAEQIMRDVRQTIGKSDKLPSKRNKRPKDKPVQRQEDFLDGQ